MFFAVTNLLNPRCVSCYVEKADGDSKLSEAELERSCDFRHYVAEVACSVGTCCGGPVREHAVGVSGMTRVRRSCLVLQYVGTRDSQPC